MRNLFTLIAIITAINSCYAQGAIGSVNSGAYSGNNLLFTVGEIYVLPTGNPNESNSGIGGIINRLNLITTGINDITDAQNIKVFPNPVSNVITIETSNGQPLQNIFVYDLNGRLLNTSGINNNSADLSFLQSGSYIIATDIEKRQSFKIIKK